MYGQVHNGGKAESVPQWCASSPDPRIMYVPQVRMEPFASVILQLRQTWIGQLVLACLV